MLARTTVQHLITEDTLKPETEESIRRYHTELEANIQGGYNPAEESSELFEFVNIDEEDQVYPEIFDDYKDRETFVEEDGMDNCDGYINAELLMPDPDGNMVHGKVINGPVLKMAHLWRLVILTLCLILVFMKFNFRMY